MTVDDGELLGIDRGPLPVFLSVQSQAAQRDQRGHLSLQLDSHQLKVSKAVKIAQEGIEKDI